jgi:hypothetical protein
MFQIYWQYLTCWKGNPQSQSQKLLINTSNIVLLAILLFDISEMNQSISVGGGGE